HARCWSVYPSSCEHDARLKAKAIRTLGLRKATAGFSICLSVSAFGLSRVNLFYAESPGTNGYLNFRWPIRKQSHFTQCTVASGKCAAFIALKLGELAHVNPC